MSDLMSKKDVVNVAKDFVFTDETQKKQYMDFLNYCLNNAPTIEAKPVVRGEWHLLDKCSNAGVYCSVCHKKVYKEPYYANVKVKSNFCPNCGARMVKDSD